MANWFVNSVDGVGGLGDGTSWANAYLTLAAALTAKAAGDTFWVGSNHAETQASAMTLTSPGTVGNPCFIYCVDHTKASPGTGDLATTGTISTTGASALAIIGSVYYYGITFTAGSTGASVLTQVSITAAWQVYQSCKFVLGGTTAANTITIGNISTTATVASRVDWINCTVKFGAAGNNISTPNTQFSWRNTASAIDTSVATPTNLFVPGRWGNLNSVEGVDLSALGSGKTLVGAATAPYSFFFKDCQFGASVTVAATPNDPGSDIFVTRSDSAATNYRSEKYSYTGTETTETSITQVGGATDGTTPQSRKYVTTANSKWVLPFQGLPLRIWCPFSSGSHTIQVFGTINAGAVPNNDDFWCDLEYLGSSANPLGSFTSGTKANNLATGSPLTVDTSTWNGGGSGAGWSPFSLTLTFSPLQAGYVYIYPKAAKASTTYYLDPTPLLS